MFKDDYEKTLYLLRVKKKTFRVQRKRSTSVFIDSKTNKFICKVRSLKDNSTIVSSSNSKSVSMKMAISLFGRVKIHINNFILKNNFNIPYVSKVYPSSFINEDVVKKLRVNDCFYYVDVNHCYWRVAYLLDILPESIYHQCVNEIGFKTFRNASLAMIVSPKEVDYYVNGELAHSISEVTSIYSDVYEYIRHTVHDMFGTICFDKLETKKCIGYIVDAVMVKRAHLKSVTEYLDAYNLTYKIVKCKVLNQNEYVYDIDSNKAIKDIRQF